METIEWRSIPGFEGIYEVSSEGRVRRVCEGAGRAKKGHILAPGRNPKGYLAVNLCRNGKMTTKFLHVLVCEVFHGPKPSPVHQAAHRDDIKDNNTKDNLYWATPLENHADRRRNGRILVGSQIGRATLREHQVRHMFVLRKQGMTCADIAKKYRVAPHTVSRILQGERWGHLGLAAGGK